MVLCSWLLCFSFCVTSAAVPVEIVFVWLGTVEKKEHSIRALTSDAQALNAQLLSTRKQHQKELQQRPQVNLILFFKRQRMLPLCSMLTTFNVVLFVP